MAVIINEIEVPPSRPEQPVASPDQQIPPATPHVDMQDVAHALRQHLERLARVRAD